MILQPYSVKISILLLRMLKCHALTSLMDYKETQALQQMYFITWVTQGVYHECLIKDSSINQTHRNELFLVNQCIDNRMSTTNAEDTNVSKPRQCNLAVIHCNGKKPAESEQMLRRESSNVSHSQNLLNPAYTAFCSRSFMAIISTFDIHVPLTPQMFSR